MNKNLLALTFTILPLIAFGAVTGCKNTAEGVAEDSANAGQAVAQTAEKTGEAVAKGAEKVGEKTAQAADTASKVGKEAGQDVAGALQVTPLVKTAIAADSALNDPKNKIDVDTKDGVVHLKGHVTSQALKAKASQVAEQRIKENKGTDKVMNQLIIQP